MSGRAVSGPSDAPGYYCERCDGPISAAELDRGRFFITRSGRMFCGACANRVPRWGRWLIGAAVAVAAVAVARRPPPVQVTTRAPSTPSASRPAADPAPALAAIERSATAAHAELRATLAAQSERHQTHGRAQEQRLRQLESELARLASLASAARTRREAVDPRLAPVVARLYARSAATRATAIAELHGLGTPEAGRQLALTLADPDPIVRSLAARALGALGQPEAAAALILLLTDDALHVRRAAGDALARLGGATHGFEPDGPAAARAAAIARWRAWWLAGGQPRRQAR